MIHTHVSGLVASFEAAEASYAAAADDDYAAFDAGRPTSDGSRAQEAVAKAREALSGLLTARAVTSEESALRIQVLAKIVTEEVYENLHAPLAMAVAVDLASQAHAT